MKWISYHALSAAGRLNLQTLVVLAVLFVPEHPEDQTDLLGHVRLQTPVSLSPRECLVFQLDQLVPENQLPR